MIIGYVHVHVVFYTGLCSGGEKVCTKICFNENEDVKFVNASYM